MVMSHRSHGLDVSTELHGFPMVLKLRIACAFNALSMHALSCHGAHTASALHVHGTHTALTPFCLHSEVVEITGRVLISQLRHGPMIVTMPQLPAFVKPCSNQRLLRLGVFVSEWYPQHLHHPASAEPSYMKAVAPLSVAHPSVMVKRLFICIHHSIYTFLFVWLVYCDTNAIWLIDMHWEHNDGWVAPFNRCRSAVRNIALRVSAVYVPGNRGRDAVVLPCQRHR